MEQAIDAVAFGLELEQHIRLFGKKRNNFTGKPDVGIQGETIGNFTGADAKEKAAMLAQQFFSFLKKIVDVAENLERRIVSQVFLQVTVTAIHRAVAREVNDK